MLAKTKLNTTEVLISNTIIDSNISHDELFIMSNVLKEYSNIKNKWKILRVHKYDWCNNKKGYIKNRQRKINLYYIKYSKFTNNNDIKIKREIDEKTSLYS